MEFEFDPAKSAANLAKHGIDFASVQQLWRRRTVQAPALTNDEPRFLVVGTLGGKHWTAVITRRGDRIRIISVRRARPKEIAVYEQIKD